MNMVIGAIIGFFLANLIIIAYGTSTEDFQSHNINLADIIKDGYKTHFAFLLSMPIFTVIIVEILKVPPSVNALVIITLCLLLDKVIRKVFHIRSKVYKKEIKIKFNPKNIYGTKPCCCQKGNHTKFLASTIFCFFCNITKARKVLKTNSFCEKYNWAKTCRTCHNHGEYHIFKGKI